MTHESCNVDAKRKLVQVVLSSPERGAATVLGAYF
jgi:hypothetical protein